MKLQPLILIAGILWYELYTHVWAVMVLRLSVGYASHACNHTVVRSGPFIGEDSSNDERLASAGIIDDPSFRLLYNLSTPAIQGIKLERIVFVSL